MKRLITTLTVLIVAVILISTLWPLGTVGAGQRGILTRWGAVTGKVYGEGLFVRIPVADKIVIMDVKIQKEQVEASAASKDLQSVSSIMALNFHINPDKVASIYQEIGTDYRTRLIDPALQESVKSSMAKYTAEELITKREAVRDDIKNHLTTKLQSRGIEIDDFNIVDFSFSRSFNEAIEVKVTAEQSALAARNKLEQIKFEAEQKVAEAKGKAEALRIEAAALKDSPQILQLRTLEKWDGRLPSVMSGTVPFLDVGALVANPPAPAPAPAPTN
ncbi:prohibitin family protein [Patescibacteria group bacterium]|nr:prohibitin family protein [Patescibacteria group bacterium]MBU1448372.1 prohibitin family protein [Patescibacteria group bacterium]MBU2613411.1 prohibitin family protein [Patescibacteria group bacterium]